MPVMVVRMARTWAVTSNSATANGDRRRMPTRRGRLARHGWRIQADDGVKVRDGAALHLGDFHVVDANTGGGFTHGPLVAAQESAQRYGEAPPEFGGVPGEQDVPGVVVAVFAQGLTHTHIIIAVDGAAPQRLPMPTPAVAAAAGIVKTATVAIVGVVSGGVHGPETRCGQGDEHLRVLGDGGRHVVVSAVQAGP